MPEWTSTWRIVCPAVVLAFLLGTATASAQTGEADIAASSSIELVERADSGSYQRYTIAITSVDGVASLVADKDGRRIETALAQGEYLALWRQLLQADLLSLATPEGARAVPDQSRFVVRHRIGAEEGGFSAYGVDSLADTRYRSVVRAILAVGDRHMARAR